MNANDQTTDETCERLEAEVAAARKARDEVAEKIASAALAAVARFEARVIVNTETTYATIGSGKKSWTTRKRATLAAAQAAGEAARAKFMEQNPKWTGQGGQRRVRIEVVDLATRATVATKRGRNGRWA